MGLGQNYRVMIELDLRTLDSVFFPPSMDRLRARVPAFSVGNSPKRHLPTQFAIVGSWKNLPMGEWMEVGAWAGGNHLWFEHKGANLNKSDVDSTHSSFQIRWRQPNPSPSSLLDIVDPGSKWEGRSPLQEACCINLPKKQWASEWRCHLSKLTPPKYKSLHP